MTALEHLGRSVLGRRYSPATLFIMVTCYLDEAGGKQDGHTVVCGWVSTVALWEQFEIDWKLFLTSYKVPYFHMKEFSQSTGPFKKWKDLSGIRDRFMAEGIDIIKSRTQYWLVCFVHHKIFDLINAKYRLVESIPSPYALAGRTCVAQVDAWSRKESKTVEYIFEDGGPDKAGLLKAMNVPVKFPDPIFKPSRDITDRKIGLRNGIVQLQAADLLAYELRKHRLEFAKRSGRPVRKSLYAAIDMMPKLLMASPNPNNILDLCRLDRLEERK